MSATEIQVVKVGQAFLTKTHAANYLDLSERQIDRMAAAGLITPFVVGGRRLFDRDELERAVRQGAGRRCKRRPQRSDAEREPSNAI